MIKIRGEMKEQCEKIKRAKRPESWFFGKNNNIYKLIAKLTKK